MQSNSNNQTLAALLTVLRPIARILMKVGVGYREFAEIAKCAFVDVSTNEYGLRGRPTNISRVAVMTGLTRKEVKRIRNKIDAGQANVVSKNAPYIAILERWHDDPAFLDEMGRPRELDFDGSNASFAALVKKYGGDIPPGAMRTELRRVNAISEDSNGRLRVLMRVFRPVDVENKLEASLGQALVSMADTLSHNFDAPLDELRIQRHAFSTAIKSSDLVRVRRISRDRVAEFIESVNEIYAAYSTVYGDEPHESNSDAVVGIGAYYFECRGPERRFFLDK